MFNSLPANGFKHEDNVEKEMRKRQHHINVQSIQREALEQRDKKQEAEADPGW